MKESENQNQRDKTLRDQIIRLVKRHAMDSGKALSSFRIRWNQAGHDLSINGYAIEWKDKPLSK